MFGLMLRCFLRDAEPNEGEGGADNSGEKTPVTEDGGQSKTENGSQPKTFTESQVNDIVRERLDRQKKATFEKLGVKSDEEVDRLIENSKSYSQTKEAFDKLSGENTILKQELMFISNNINPDKKEDILAMFKGKGIELTDEELKKQIVTHPEWVKEITTITSLGSDHGSKGDDGNDERQKAMRLFHVNGFVSHR